MLTLLLLSLLQQQPAAAPAQEEIPLALRVNRAIALGVDYLKRAQRRDGSFAGHEDHPGGETALVAYTLVKSGVRRNDPALVRALEALQGNVFQTTYSASVHLLLCAALNDPQRRAEARASLDFLLANQEEKGVWSYPGKHLCNSNTQFALLGLRAARLLGLEVPEETWIAAAEGLRIFQDKSGGFQYMPGDRLDPVAGMTAAALASWAVLEEVARDSPKVRAALARRAGVQKEAEDWLEHHFDLTRNEYGDGSWTPSWQVEFLWAVERWCGLTQREKFAGRDWYEEGARYLLATQARDGSWPSTDRPQEDTCFALLFLRRATISPGGELAELYSEIDRQRSAVPDELIRPGPDALRLTDFLLAGPWVEGGGGVLLLDPPFDPAGIKPKLGAKLAHHEWQRVTLSGDSWTNLDKFYGPRGADEDIWVMATWLAWEPKAEAPAPFEGYLWLDLEDGWDVWLDGKRVSRERRRAAGVRGDVRLELSLSPGEHLLYVLVEDRIGVAAFGARVTDRANRAPPAGFAARAAPVQR